MTQLGDVLALMYGARGRFVPMRAIVREWHDGPGLRRAEERFAASPEGRAEGWQLHVDQLAERGSYESYEATTRLWIDDPERIRRRTEAEGRPAVERTRGPREVDFIDDWLDPMRLLGTLEVEPVQEREVAARPTVTLLARRRQTSGLEEQFTLFLLGRGADAYELDVDGELGILTRTAALLNGREYRVREAIELDLGS